MHCCLNTHLLINHLLEKKNTINVWLRRKLNQNQQKNLCDKEIIVLEESKYIKKVGCCIRKYTNEENLNNNCMKNLVDKVENDEKISLFEKFDKPAHLTRKHLSKESLNADEWELFFVLGDENSNQSSQQVVKGKNSLKNTDEPAAKKKSMYQTNSDNLEDYEWDDFGTDEIILNYDDEDKLIKTIHSVNDL